jgi:hypothetical protein
MKQISPLRFPAERELKRPLSVFHFVNQVFAAKLKAERRGTKVV